MCECVSMDRSAENQRVGNVTIAAWQMEERTDQRMSVGRLPDSINGRVRVSGRDAALLDLISCMQNITVNVSFWMVATLSFFLTDRHTHVLYIYELK